MIGLVPSNKIRKSLDSILSFTLIVVFFSGLCFFVIQNRHVYQEKFDVGYWDEVYRISQWNTPHPEKFISDGELYAIAGSKYIRGEDPVNVSPEHPPLGKYLIGISIVLFKNEKIMSLLTGLLTLVVFFFLAKEIFGRTSVALSLVTLFSFEPIFRSQLTTTMLDLPQLFFTILATIFFLKAKKNHLLYPLVAFSLGCVISTKIFASGLILLGLFIFYLLLSKDFRGLRSFLISCPLIFAVYLSVYIVHFFYNMNLAYFFRYHQWLIDWWTRTGGGVSWGRVWRMLFTGWWHTWWEPEFIRFGEWSLSWPLLTLCSLISPFFYWRDKRIRVTPIFLIILWVLGYLAFLHMEAVFPRHLLFIFPGFYIMTLFVLREVFQILVKLIYSSVKK